MSHKKIVFVGFSPIFYILLLANLKLQTTTV